MRSCTLAGYAAAPGQGGLSPGTHGGCLLLSMWDVETAEQVTALIPPEATAREPGVGPMPGGCVSHMREPNCSAGFAFNVPSGSLQPETPRVFWPDGQRKWTCGHGDVHHVGSAIRRARLWKRSQGTPAQCRTSGESKDRESETPDRAVSLNFHSYPVASPVLSHLCLHFVGLTPLGWPCLPQGCSVFRVAGPSPHCPSGRARI